MERDPLISLVYTPTTQHDSYLSMLAWNLNACNHIQSINKNHINLSYLLLKKNYWAPGRRERVHSY